MGAVAVTRGWEKWSAPQASNSGEHFTETVVVPSQDLAEALLERLVARSNSAEGFDRATLKNLDRDAWGITDS
jgi:hypothetical protein